MSLSTVDAFKHIRSDECIELSDDELRKLQSVLVGILDDICAVCDDNCFDYELGGGSALGAYRDHGFIPWDDDIDINMPRRDYDGFIAKFRERFGEKYWIHTPQGTGNYGLMLTRILLKGTSVKTREDFCNPECGAFIDIFVIENTYDNPFMRKVHEIGCMGYGFLVSCRKFRRDREPLMKLARSTADRAIIRKFRTKIIIGTLISWRNLDGLVRNGDRWNGRCRDENSEYVTIPTGRKLFKGELYLRDDICRTTKLPYCGAQRRCPAAITEYLTRLYGKDFMEPPAKQDREKHLFFRPFYLDNSMNKESTL